MRYAHTHILQHSFGSIRFTSTGSALKLLEHQVDHLLPPSLSLSLSLSFQMLDSSRKCAQTRPSFKLDDVALCNPLADFLDWPPPPPPAFATVALFSRAHLSTSLNYTAVLVRALRRLSPLCCVAPVRSKSDTKLLSGGQTCFVTQ